MRDSNNRPVIKQQLTADWQKGGSVLRRHICGENRHLRVAANR